MAWLIMVGVLALPVAEIMVWVRLADAIGALATIALTIAAIMAGGAILRRQGLAALLSARGRMDRGEPPVAAVFDGLCLTLAGFLLVLPGFITDILAGLLLLPPVRALLLRQLAARLVVVRNQDGPAGPGPTVIEADYQVVEAEPPPGPAPDHKRLEP